METRGRFTREEIFSQPEAWMAAIDVLKEQSMAIQDFAQHYLFEQVIFTGCGSTYYLSLAGAALFQEMTGRSARGLPASELWLYPRTSIISSGKVLLIAISRSGETTETLNVCHAFRALNRGEIITVVCNPDSQLTKMGTLNLIFPSGMEKSIAQTRAFSTLYLGVVGLCTLWSSPANRLDKITSLPFIGKRLITNSRSVAEQYGKNLNLDQVYFLGSGARYGLACELNLKMKEMSLTHSEAFHFLEFRHGPKAMVNRRTLVVGLVSDINSETELAVLREIKELGAEIISIGDSHTDIALNSGLEEVFRNILYLPFGQMMAFERSIAKGLDPDHPNNLDSVVKLI